MSLCRVEVDACGPWPVARLTGEVDLSNAVALRSRVEGAVTNRAPGLVLDLSGVTYLDSTGLHLVFGLARRLRDRQQALRVVVPASSRIRRLVTVAGVESVAEVVEDLHGDRCVGSREGPA